MKYHAYVSEMRLFHFEFNLIKNTFLGDKVKHEPMAGMVLSSDSYSVLFRLSKYQTKDTTHDH